METALDALNPQVLLEAGDTPWDDVHERIVRLVEGMLPGDVLEVTSMVAGLGESLAGWCARVGHLLLGSREADGKTTYWVRKVEEEVHRK